MNKIEVAFGISGGVDDGRLVYLDLQAAEIPRIGETVRLAGTDLQGARVADVKRTYNVDTNELSCVYVLLRTEESA